MRVSHCSAPSSRVSRSDPLSHACSWPCGSGCCLSLLHLLQPAPHHEKISHQEMVCVSRDAATSKCVSDLSISRSVSHAPHAVSVPCASGHLFPRDTDQTFRLHKNVLMCHLHAPSPSGTCRLHKKVYEGKSSCLTSMHPPTQGHGPVPPAQEGVRGQELRGVHGD